MLQFTLLLLLAGFLGRQISGGHLTNTDELFTAERARELRFSGPEAVWDNFRPVLQKPPLQYWLTAGALALLPETRKGPRVCRRCSTRLAPRGWWGR